jgi:hypothetical protein
LALPLSSLPPKQRSLIQLSQAGYLMERLIGIGPQLLEGLALTVTNINRMREI